MVCAPEPLSRAGQRRDLRETISALGKLHGRTSHAWNGEDSMRGRKVWSPPADRLIRNEAHFWATMNYIHHNPIKHGHAQKWHDWPFSSAIQFLEMTGKEESARIWQSYPILNYGAGWDD